MQHRSRRDVNNLNGALLRSGPSAEDRLSQALQMGKARKLLTRAVTDKLADQLLPAFQCDFGKAFFAAKVLTGTAVCPTVSYRSTVWKERPARAEGPGQSGGGRGTDDTVGDGSRWYPRPRWRGLPSLLHNRRLDMPYFEKMHNDQAQLAPSVYADSPPPDR